MLQPATAESGDADGLHAGQGEGAQILAGIECGAADDTIRSIDGDGGEIKGASESFFPDGGDVAGEGEAGDAAAEEGIFTDAREGLGQGDGGEVGEVIRVIVLVCKGIIGELCHAFADGDRVQGRVVADVEGLRRHGVAAAADGQFLQRGTIPQNVIAVGGDAVREGDGLELIAVVEGVIVDQPDATAKNGLFQTCGAECVCAQGVHAGQVERAQIRAGGECVTADDTA